MLRIQSLILLVWGRETDPVAPHTKGIFFMENILLFISSIYAMLYPHILIILQALLDILIVICIISILLDRIKQPDQKGNLRSSDNV